VEGGFSASKLDDEIVGLFESIVRDSPLPEGTDVAEWIRTTATLEMDSFTVLGPSLALRFEDVVASGHQFKAARSFITRPDDCVLFQVTGLSVDHTRNCGVIEQGRWHYVACFRPHFREVMGLVKFLADSVVIRELRIDFTDKGVVLAQNFAVDADASSFSIEGVRGEVLGRQFLTMSQVQCTVSDLRGDI
jgi:hypothetical protein